MFRDLETERLYLKNISHEDDAFFYKQFSSDEVNRYLFDTEPCSSVSEASGWIDFYMEEEPRNQHRWILVLKENGETIGTCGFHCWSAERHEVEIGYDLCRPIGSRDISMKQSAGSLTLPQKKWV